MICPSSVSGLECSGHGVCWTISDIAALTLEPFTTYGSTLTAQETIAWDFNLTRSCVCNSSWEVGYEFGQYQLSEYYQPDCSQSMYNS